MDAIDVAVACGIGSGIIVAAKVVEVADACGSTIVAVGEIETGTVAQDVRKVESTKRYENNFMATNLESASLLAYLGNNQSRVKSYTMTMDDIYKTYHHNPPHYFVPNAMYIVTGSLLYKQRLLTDDKRKSIVCEILFERAEHLGWELEAWAVLENHYHFIAHAPENALTLEKLIRQLHSKAAVALNKLDDSPGRQVWHNYWDTCITHETSYNARLHYVHLNPVKHGLVENAENYPFCSYRWFLEKVDDSFRDTVMNQPIDRVDIFDDFD